MPEILQQPRPSDLLELPDDMPVHEMNDEEFAAYDEWNSELELAAGMDEREQAEFDAMWEAL